MRRYVICVGIGIVAEYIFQGKMTMRKLFEIDRHCRLVYLSPFILVWETCCWSSLENKSHHFLDSEKVCLCQFHKLKGASSSKTVSGNSGTIWIFSSWRRPYCEHIGHYFRWTLYYTLYNFCWNNAVVYHLCLWRCNE